MKRLQETRKGARKVYGDTLQLMSLAEKRNLITKVIDECHERVLQSIACKRAFHATSMWLLVAHLEVNESGATKDQYYAPKELGVNIKHLPKYKYIQKCPKNKVQEEVVTWNRKEVKERKEEEKRKAEEASEQEEEERLTVPFVTKDTRIISRLEERVCASIAEETGKNHASTGITRFVIGGFHALLRVTDAYAELEGTKDNGDMEGVPLVYNDIGVFHGELTRDKTKHLFVDKCRIKKFSIKGVAAEVKIIECRKLSPENFPVNNDINITGS